LEVKVMTAIFIEVENHDRAETACSEITLSLRHQMSGFPYGEVVGVNVDRYELVTADEHERYFAE
jgi:hypothetical protein